MSCEGAAAAWRWSLGAAASWLLEPGAWPGSRCQLVAGAWSLAICELRGGSHHHLEVGCWSLAAKQKSGISSHFTTGRGFSEVPLPEPPGKRKCYLWPIVKQRILQNSEDLLRIPVARLFCLFSFFGVAFLLLKRKCAQKSIRAGGNLQNSAHFHKDFFAHGALLSGERVPAACAVIGRFGRLFGEVNSIARCCEADCTPLLILGGSAVW